MTPQLWIGFGFLTLLVLFLIVSFFRTPRLTIDQRATLKVLSALCAGFSGGFLTGSALFEYHYSSGPTTWGVSGVAGGALFFFVWIFYPKVFKLPDAFVFSIPKDWDFSAIADSMVQTRAALVELVGFQDQELHAAMQSRQVETTNLREALRQLRLLTVTPNAIRPYNVTQDGTVYRLHVQ